MENDKLKELETKIFKMLDVSEDWTLSDYTLTHKNGLSLWISNGIDSLSIHKPSDLSLPSDVAARLWEKIEWMLGKSVELSVYALAAQKKAKQQEAENLALVKAIEQLESTAGLKAVA